MNGFIIVNKPTSITSFDVIRQLKKCLPRKTKIGHLGTLDPMATGVLPVAIGQATKIIPYLENDCKQYVVVMTLGGKSDTQDAWGNITYTNTIKIDEEEIKDTIKKMIGEIEQIPPMYSAVHHEGRKLYELARQGITVERKARKITIYNIEIISINLNKQFPIVEFKVDCSKGTYIRTLCNDIGDKLGIGGFMSGLIRTKSGMFDINHSYNLNEILLNKNISDYMLPMDFPLQNWPYYILKQETEFRLIKNGNTIYTTSELLPGYTRIYNNDGSFIAIAKAFVKDKDKKDIYMALKPVRVF